MPPTPTLDMDEYMKNMGQAGTVVMWDLVGDEDYQARQQGLAPTSVLTPVSSIKARKADWSELALAQKLGFQVQCTKKTLRQFEQASKARNQTLKTLTTDCGPGSATFGKPKDIGHGSVFFKFSQGDQILGKGHLHAMELFVKEKLVAIKAAVDGDDLEKAKEEYKSMNVHTFKVFVKEHRAEQGNKGHRKSWETLSFPVQMHTSACETCGVEGGEKLLRCGRCKKVAYCSKECQKDDWKSHKPFCSS